ncbi:MAG: gliding motility-associated C-terminal domain-containing protein, partial [Bacteroidia bacterium]
DLAGGTTAYSYAWSDGSTTVATTEDLSSVGAGTYTLTVTDANSCTATSSATTVSQPTAALAISNVAATAVDCYGNSTGAITVDVAGGTTAYTYAWSDGSNTVATTEDLSSVGAGTYTLTVTDANSCTATSNATTISQPSAALTITDTTNANVDCYGSFTGYIDISVSGGTSAYTYTWSNSSTSQDINGLGAGKYTITVTDANSCTTSSTIYITQPDQLLFTGLTADNPTCVNNTDGKLTLTATGGVNPKYSIDSGTNFQSSNIFTGLGIGIYKVVITDDSACTATYSISQYDTLINGDKTAPNAVANNDTLYLDVNGEANTSYSNIFNSASFDNCEISNIYLSDSAFTCNDTGINTIILYVEDLNGNIDTAHSTIIVLDTLSPTITTKNAIAFLDANGNFQFNDTLVVNSVIDNCALDTVIVNPTSFSCADTGVNNKVFITAYDIHGNISYDSAYVRVYDNIPPTAIAKNVTVYLDNSGNGVIDSSDVNDGSFDNCSIKLMEIDTVRFSCTDVGNQTRRFVVTDYSGNTDTTYFQVFVLDTTKPIVSTQTATVYLDTAAKGSINNKTLITNINDNCGSIDTVYSQYNFTKSDTGWVDIDIIITDKNGNITFTKSRVWVEFGDSDNDSIPDYIEGPKDTDGDGVPDYLDLDSDNDGILDVIENEGQDTLIDLDGDGIPNYRDLDSDGDGIDDVIEVDGNDTDFDGIAGTGNVAVDKNGVPIIASGGYTPVDTDNDGKDDYKDLDTDDDGIPDSVEKGATKDPVDSDNDGKRDWRSLDSDSDGIPDSVEKGADGNNPLDTDGDGTPDYQDLDSDNDGIPDTVEKGPDGNNPVDTDGDGTPDYQDLDSDNDGIPDTVEKGTDGNNPIDTDGDGTPDYRDLDSDNDGIPDTVEKGPDGNNPVDTDGDVTPDYQDLDSDNDGIPDTVEKGSDGNNPIDTDGDGTPDYRDLDSDNDGIPDTVEKGADGNNPIDTDGDGTPDYRDLDSDDDGIPDTVEKGADGNNPIDTDGDGTPDYRDLDSDNDGIKDEYEKGNDGNNPVDTDGDGTPDYRDIDSDNDGIKDEVEKGDDGDNPLDTDGDGIPDFRELDSDNDGLLDSDEAGDDKDNPVDTDGDGIPDYREIDSDNDEIPDGEEGLNNSKIPNIWIPEGISLNQNGQNDYLYIKGLANFTNASVTIFNRWGQVVYESGVGYSNSNPFKGYYGGPGVTFNPNEALPENVYYLIFKSNDYKNIIIKQNLYIKN